MVFGHKAEVMIVMLRGSVPLQSSSKFRARSGFRCPESGFLAAWCDMRYALFEHQLF